MPLLNCKHTDEAKRKISEAGKGRIPWNKGRKMSEYEKRNMSLVELGKIVSEETKYKISNTLKGHTVSNKTRRKISKANKCKLLGHTVSKETRQKISIANTGRKHTDETRRKLSIARKKRIISEETRRKLSDAGTRYLCSNRYKGNCTNTKPELQLKKIFKDNNIKFIHQHYVKDIKHRYAADFYLPKYNCIVEADGVYWHNYPHGNEIDHIQTAEMKEQGYSVCRFWEGQIEEKEVITKIFTQIN